MPKKRREAHYGREEFNELKVVIINSFVLAKQLILCARCMALRMVIGSRCEWVTTARFHDRTVKQPC